MSASWIRSMFATSVRLFCPSLWMLIAIEAFASFPFATVTTRKFIALIFRFVLTALWETRVEQQRFFYGRILNGALVVKFSSIRIDNQTEANQRNEYKEFNFTCGSLVFTVRISFRNSIRIGCCSGAACVNLLCEVK